MKKLALATIVAIASVCLAAAAFAGTISPGEKTTCNNAKSITLEAVGNSSAGDRGNANAVVWLSSSAITNAITLGPTDDNGLPGGAFGNTKDNLSKKGWMVSAVNMPNKHYKGHKSVTLVSQPNFSRGDSIGDISGEVRITNTGTIPLKISCN